MIRHADGTIEEARLSGQLLGVFDQPKLKDGSLTLCPGDTVVFFTDGLTEVRRGGVQFGTEGLAATLAEHGEGSCEAVADALVAAAEAHAEHGLDDDLAVVVLRVTGNDPS